MITLTTQQIEVEKLELANAIENFQYKFDAHLIKSIELIINLEDHPATYNVKGFFSTGMLLDLLLSVTPKAKVLINDNLNVKGFHKVEDSFYYKVEYKANALNQSAGYAFASRLEGILSMWYRIKASEQLA